MRTLRKEVYETLKKVNEKWVEAVLNANIDIDTTRMSSEVIGYITELDDKFEEFKERQKKVKKGIFG